MIAQDKKEKTQSKLQNTYVRDYYDIQVRSLPETYTASRWHSSIARKFDYIQTDRAIDHAFGDEQYHTAIEIGPGDGVWTKKIRAHVQGNIHLIEQSNEMFAQAKAHLKDDGGVTFERADFMEANPPRGVDLIFASRCFEYFNDKPAALRKIFESLRPGGRLIMVTKNAQYVTSVSVQDRVVHSDQLTKTEMEKLLTNAGFILEHTYPATLRWKVKNPIMRFLFDVMHRVAVRTNGRLTVPFLSTYASESFLYIASRPLS